MNYSTRLYRDNLVIDQKGVDPRPSSIIRNKTRSSKAFTYVPGAIIVERVAGRVINRFAGEKHR